MGHQPLERQIVIASRKDADWERFVAEIKEKKNVIFHFIIYTRQLKNLFMLSKILFFFSNFSKPTDFCKCPSPLGRSSHHPQPHKPRPRHFCPSPQRAPLAGFRFRPKSNFFLFLNFFKEIRNTLTISTCKPAKCNRGRAFFTKSS